MIFREVSWIRTHSSKLCPRLKKICLETYRPRKKLPCYFHRALKTINNNFKKIPVIIQTEPVRDINILAKELSSSVKIPIKKELPLINAFSTTINTKKIQTLLGNNKVKKIWFDREVKAVMDVASKTVESPALWEKGLTGKGVTIAVLDTGIFNHEDISQNIKAFKDFVKEKSSAYDDNGHGTHVAGIISSKGIKSRNIYKGIAPESNLVGVKILDKYGEGNLSRVIEGIQWCINNKASLNIRIINLSLGTSAEESFNEDPLCLAAEKAWKEGIIVCTAAGNDGPDLKTINSPGIHPAIITVGAIDDMNTKEQSDDIIAEFSSRGPTIDGLQKPDILAPGVDIISLRAPGSYSDRQEKESRIDTWYSSFSGTSMATPVCSGIVALILQKYPNSSPNEIKKRLITSAQKLKEANSNLQGAGIVNAKKAIDI